ncbi:hypothetical protein [Mesoplasma melaleucae]|uniref:ABC transporter permease n=1 Tax=Mesoplasma melaleucae TaxID=81459 RepID=A0A2K8NYE6_9MOLU|nr:hypothetical protein [Mesoplasma melaleucae]ATZ18208.1 hypothetical protein EMELA_v1c07100 [Mesoplasma melaleucae]
MTSFKLNKDSFKNWYKNYNVKDWKLWFKLIFIVILTFVVLEAYLEPLIKYSIWTHDINNQIASGKTTIKELIDYGIANKSGWISGDVGAEHINELIGITIKSDGSLIRARYMPFEQMLFKSSFFTVLSNLLVLAWMYVALIKPKNEGEKGILSDNVSIISGTYITITFLIYQLALRPVTIASRLTNGKTVIQAIFLEPLSVIQNEVFHTIVPIAFVLYIIFGMKHTHYEELTTKKMHMNWIHGIIGLVVYGLYSIIRGLIREAGGTPNTSIYAYPYFFLQITNPKGLLGVTGIVWFIIFIFVIAGLYIGFSTSYRLAIIKNQKRLQK